MAISMLKIRRPLGRLIFNMGIAIPGKTVFLIETAPWRCYEANFVVTCESWWLLSRFSGYWQQTLIHFWCLSLHDLIRQYMSSDNVFAYLNSTKLWWSTSRVTVTLCMVNPLLCNKHRAISSHALVLLNSFLTCYAAYVSGSYLTRVMLN